MAQKHNNKTVEEAVKKLLLQARQARKEERYAEAERDVLQAITLCQQAGARSTLAQTLTMLGQLARDQQQMDAALSHYEEALTIFREIADDHRVAHTVRHVADIQRSIGRFESAETCYNEALEIYRSHSQTRPLDLANAIRGLAMLKSEVNAVAEAKLLWQEAMALYEKVNVQPGVAECQQRIADLGALPNSENR